MERAMAYPWLGPAVNVLRIKASSAPCRSLFAVFGGMDISLAITKTVLVTVALTREGGGRFAEKFAVLPRETDGHARDVVALASPEPRRLPRRPVFAEMGLVER